MSKYKTRHYETFQRGMFPQAFTQHENGGETNQSGAPTNDLEGITTNDPNELLDKIWVWIDEPDDVDDV